MKIRHYGLLCSRNIKSKLSKCLKITGNKPLPLTIKIQKDARSCRSCGSPHVITVLVPYSLATSIPPFFDRTIFLSFDGVKIRSVIFIDGVSQSQ